MRGVRQVREVREVRGVREVRQVRGVREVRQVREDSSRDGFTSRQARRRAPRSENYLVVSFAPIVFFVVAFIVLRRFGG